MHPLRLLVPILFTLLAGCAGIVTEKRHTPAEIAAYRHTDFVAPIASAEGERAAAAEGREKIRVALLRTSQPAEAPSTAIGDENSGAPGALWAIAFLNADRAEGLNILQNALLNVD